MKCPTDDTLLQISERQGIEIDYCPSCRGVWLDRGELDKLIERSANEATARPAVSTRDRGRDRDHDDAGSYRNGSDKKGSFLGEIFDM